MYSQVQKGWKSADEDTRTRYSYSELWAGAVLRAPGFQQLVLRRTMRLRVMTWRNEAQVSKRRGLA